MKAYQAAPARKVRNQSFSQRERKYCSTFGKATHVNSLITAVFVVLTENTCEPALIFGSIRDASKFCRPWRAWAQRVSRPHQLLLST
jgi:hypothetical protein